MTKNHGNLKIGGVMAALSCQRNKVYDLIEAGKFPPPVKVQRASFWPEEEVSAMMTAWAAGIGEEELKEFVTQIKEARKSRFQALQQSMVA